MPIRSNIAGCRRVQDCHVVAASAPAPGVPSAPTLGHNNGTGVQLAFPVLPSGATALDLYNGAALLASGVTPSSWLLLTPGTTPAVASSTAYVFKLKARGAGGTSAASAGLNVTTVGVPGVASAPSSSGWETAWEVTTPTYPANAEGFSALEANGDGGGYGPLEAEPNPTTTFGPYDYTGFSSATARVVAYNVYGSTEGSELSVP